MKAVIMAGGQGIRLRPLTEHLPKPLVRLCGRPVLEYILELLAKNGMQEAALTLQYRSEMIRAHFSKGTFAGVLLRLYEEKQPLGTAGSVKNVVGQTDSPLMILSGDILCDLPLAQAVQAHQKSGAAATVVVVRAKEPHACRYVEVGEDGQITRFLENPSCKQAVRGLADTGIYILSPQAVDMIPQGKKYSLISDLFPAMLEKGLRLQSCILEGYWCDIRDLEAYRRAQRDLLLGRVDCALRGRRDDLGNLLAGRRPAGKYELEAPVYIGEGVMLGAHTVVGAGSVLDDGCAVGPGATVAGSVLLPCCSLGERASAVGAVVCKGASVKSRAALLEGTAIGEGALVGAHAVVRENVRIAGDARVPDGDVISGHIPAQDGQPCRFDDDGLCGEIGAELTPELAVRVGCAVGTIAAGRAVGAAAVGGRCARVLADALAAGIRSTGANVLDFGNAFEAMFGFAMGYNGLHLGVYLNVSAEQPCAIKILCDAGLPATRRIEREIEQALGSGRFARAPQDGFGERVDMSGIGVIYLNELLRLSPKGLLGVACSVHSPDRNVRDLLGSALEKLGCTLSGGITLTLPQNGASLTLSDGKTTISRQRTVAAYCMVLFEQHQDVAVENDFPRALDLLAQEQGQRVYRYLSCPEDEPERECRRLAVQQRYARDGLTLAVLLLDYMHRKGLTLSELDQRLPAFTVEEESVRINLPPAKLLGQLQGEPAGEGLLVRSRQGVVLLRPRKSGDAIRVFAEAASWETARELCTDFSSLLSGLLDNSRGNG